MLKEAVRKPRFTLLDIPFLRRCAEHMTKGAEKYGPDNWRLANSLEEQRGFQDSDAVMRIIKVVDADEIAARFKRHRAVSHECVGRFARRSGVPVNLVRQLGRVDGALPPAAVSPEVLEAFLGATYNG
jgi:hypothetical protein